VSPQVPTGAAGADQTAAETARAALHAILDGHILEREAMRGVVEAFMSGDCPETLIAGVLVALRQRGEAVAEIAGAAEALRARAAHIDIGLPHLVDTCGTGGDGHNSFNISTTCAFVAAAAGANVVKHGNRSVSSSSGSADVLEALGARIDLGAEAVRAAVERHGVGFLFAPTFHQAMRHVAPVRKTLALRTLFNVLGPLCNPARPPAQVLGVFSADWIARLAEVAQMLGSAHVLVVSGADGSDEFSLAGPTHVAELKAGTVHRYSVTPADFGLSVAPAEALAVRSPEDSAAVIRQVLAGEPGPARDVVLLNAGAALYAAGLSASHATGVEAAIAAIDSGAAAAKLNDYIAFTRQQHPA